MTSEPALRRTAHPRLLIVAAAVAAVGALVTVSACSGSGGANSSAAPASALQKNAAMPGAIPDGSASGQAGRGQAFGTGGTLTHINLSSFDRAQIKIAGIELRSTKVADVVTSLEQIATTEGGYVDSENTATDVHGVATSSTVTLRVPVDSFDTAVDEVSGLGQLVSKKTTTQDVTGRVADVNSRVRSAREAIAQLRLLFNRATKLGDIIALESQLSDREANLEALEAQQRALTAQTTMSTISVHVTRPPSTLVTKKHHEDTSGFVGGLRQGWDALVATAAAVGHGLGAALPLGIVVIVLALLAWPLVRRLPRHRPNTSG